MKFKDLYFSKEKFFSVGVEEKSGRYYLSIPVGSTKADYEEYYWLDNDTYKKHESDLSSLEFLAEECRKRFRDDDLVYKPGSEREGPV